MSCAASSCSVPITHFAFSAPNLPCSLAPQFEGFLSSLERKFPAGAYRVRTPKAYFSSAIMPVSAHCHNEAGIYAAILRTTFGYYWRSPFRHCLPACVPIYLHLWNSDRLVCSDTGLLVVPSRDGRCNRVALFAGLTFGISNPSHFSRLHESCDWVSFLFTYFLNVGILIRSATMIPFPFAANSGEPGRSNHLRPLLTLSETTQLSAFLVRKLSTAFFNSQNGDKIGTFPVT